MRNRKCYQNISCFFFFFYKIFSFLLKAFLNDSLTNVHIWATWVGVGDNNKSLVYDEGFGINGLLVPTLVLKQWRKCTFGPYVLALFPFWSPLFYFTAFSPQN